MDTTIMGLYTVWGLLGLYRENGKENGNCHVGFKGIGPSNGD